MSQRTVKKEDIAKVMQNLKARRENAPIEIPTGFVCLDEMLGGLHKGQMIVIAGHPSIGKTGFAINIVEHLCFHNNIPVAFYSMQLSREQLLERMLFSYSKIELIKARRGKINNNEWEMIAAAGNVVSEKPLYINDTPRLTPVELRNRIESISTQPGSNIQCAIIDTIQMMNSDEPHNILRHKIADISENLKKLAIDYDIPVIVLCDLDLELVVEPGKRRSPQMNDFGEYIIMERYADVIMLLHRDHYYCRGEADFEPNDNAELMITRNHNGPTGVIMLRFSEETVRFEDLVAHK